MSGKYLKARQLAKEMEEKAEKTAKKKEEVKEKKKAAEKLLKVSNDLEMDTNEIEEKIEKGKEEIKDKNFEKAGNKFEGIIEELHGIHSDKLDEMLESVKGFLKISNEIDEDSKLRKEVEEAENFLEEGRIKESFEKAEEIQKKSESVIEEELSDQLENVKALLESVEEAGKEKGKAEKIVLKADYAYEGKEYERAISLIRDARDLIGDKLQDEFGGILSKLETKIDRLNKRGIDTSKSEKLLKKAKKRNKEEDYGSMVRYIQMCRDQVDEHFVRILRETIGELEDEIEEAKDLGAQVRAVEEMIDEIENCLSDKKVEKAGGLLDEAFEKVKELKFEEVLNTIAESREYFIKAKDIGADIKEPMQILSKARDSLKAGDYKEALDLAKKGRKKVQSLVKEYDEVRQKINDKEKKVKELKDTLPIELPQVEDIISRAEDRLQKEKYDESLEVLEEFDEKFDKRAYEKIMEEIEKFERLNKVGEEIGAEMEDLSDKLDEAVAKTKSSEYTKAAELANKGKSASKEKIETKIEEMRKNLSMILEDEIHIDEDAQDKLEDLLAKSLNRLNSENYIQAHSVLEDAKEELKQSRATSAEKRIKELSEFLSILEEDIDTEKVDINSYKEYIKEAKKNLSEDKYEITLNKIDELKTNLNEELKEETEQVFGRAKMEVIRAKKTGVDIESFRKNLIKCKKNMKQDDYIEAIRVSHETEKRAKKEREMRKRAYESISDTASQLSTMKKEGRVDDISEIKETLVKAKNEFREKNYSDANETVKKANTMLEQRKGKSEFEEKKEALIEKIEKIKDQDHLTMETEEIEAELEQASNLVEKNKFSKAVEMAETADDLLEERLKENLEQLIAETKSDMKSAKKLGADMEGLDLEVSEAESSFGKERYFECLEILEEVEGKIEEYRGLHDSTAEKIEEVKEKILEAEQINAKIGDVRKLLDDAKTAFENHRYEQSLEKAEEANAIINKKIENKVDEIINEFEKKIDTYRSEEGDTTLADDFIQKAKKAKEDENYKEAINYSMQSEGELEKIELQQNIAHKSIAKAKQKMNKAEEKDLMIDQPKKILEESKNAYKSGFYVKAFDKAAKVSNELNEILECYEETEAFLKSIGDIIEEIKKEKENIDDLIEAKEQITNRFKNGDYKRAYSCLDEIENVLEKKTVKEVIERLQKEIESVPDEEERREVKKVLEDASTTLDIQGSLKAINLISKAKEISGVRKKEKYENTINEVENLVDKAKKFGASVKGVENKIDTAKGLKDEDKIDEASKKAKEALDQVEETLEDYSPKIEIKMPEDLKLNEWNDSKILFKNKGNGVAQSPEIEIYGGETEGFKLQDKLKAGEKTEISGRIKPTSEKAYIIARAVRIFDKKEIEEEYELQFTDEIKKEEIKNEKLCEICEKVVKGSEEMITCSCGSAFHESCIDEKKECPSCGVDIKSEAEENKDQRRVGMDI